MCFDLLQMLLLLKPNDKSARAFKMKITDKCEFEELRVWRAIRSYSYLHVVNKNVLSLI